MLQLQQKLQAWVEHRTGVFSAWQRAANRPVPGGAKLWHAFPSVLMFLFAQEVVLGVVMAMYYSPTAAGAWASVAYLNDQVTLGWFLRGLHHHTSYAMVIVGVLYAVYLVIVAGYRRPREVYWLTAVALGGLCIAMGLSGSLLPWDEQAVGRIAVETSIMASVPGGEAQRLLLVGGKEFGNFTLLRLYSFHVFVLPLLFAGLMLLHRKQVVRHGEVAFAQSSDEAQQRATRFFPHQLFLDVLAVTVVGSVLLLATVNTHGTELFGPLVSGSKFQARPEWYFLFLNQLLHYCEGPLQIVGTVILPGAAVSFLAALPWVDRAESPSFKARAPVLAGVGLLMAGAVTLSALAVLRDKNDAEYNKGLAQAHKFAEYTRTLAKAGVLPAGGDAVLQNDPKYQVITLFKEHCQNCHTLAGVGGNEAPDFSDYNSRAWLTALIRNPQDARFFGGIKRKPTDPKHEGMDAYPVSEVSDSDLKALVEYCLSLAGEETTKAAHVDVALAKKGEELWSAGSDEINCSDCHEVTAGESGDGPNLFGRGSKEWMVKTITDSGVDELFGKDAKMPKFGSKLSPQQMGQLAEYILESAQKPTD